jgi:thiol-disulfide isomerase/thioredoxin
MIRMRSRDRLTSLGAHSSLALAWALLLTVISAGSVAAQRLEAIDLQGRKIDLRQASAGKPIVVFFVRTDCPISNRYAPVIEHLQSAYRGRAAFWLVYPDNDEPAEKIRAHMKDYGLTLPVLRDPGHTLVRMSQAEVTPEAAVFAPDGALSYHGRIDNLYESVGRSRSAPTTHELYDALQALLAGKPPPVSTATAVGCTILDMR